MPGNSWGVSSCEFDTLSVIKRHSYESLCGQCIVGVNGVEEVLPNCCWEIKI